ncbi:hypothetical protein RN001_001658 [Aquatica leii]|uniref:Uncharacterized protein n=1 Tax=Aquatica leii TaxID=1421715 RepID=A0AAN7PG83_9COLE|nr:hypothetical protein RN001_001658 [Aquatica leii]
MKTLILIVSVLIFAKVNSRTFESVPFDTPDVIMDNILDGTMCAQKVGLKNFPRTQNINREGILPEDNEQLNLYYSCIYQRKGIIDENGILNLDNLRLYLRNLFTMSQAITPAQKKLVDDSIDYCKDIQSQDYGEKSVKLQNCVMNKLYDLVKE